VEALPCWAGAKAAAEPARARRQTDFMDEDYKSIDVAFTGLSEVLIFGSYERLQGGQLYIYSLKRCRQDSLHPFRQPPIVGGDPFLQLVALGLFDKRTQCQFGATDVSA
jgi:hypothetical protein